MKNGLFVTNNAFDAVVLANGTYLEVNKQVMKDYLDTANIDIGDWVGGAGNDWVGEDVETAAKELGTVIAYYEDDKLVVVDEELMAERKDFHLDDTVKVMYEDIVVGEITTNRSLTVDEALELIGFDEEKLLQENGFDDIDYNDFKLVY